MTDGKRGVRAQEPARPAMFFTEFWSRRVVNHAASAALVPVGALLGKERARSLLNGIAGEPLCFHDDRLVPQLGVVGRYGFIILPGGCAWALEKHDGCTFCPFQPAVDRYVGDLPLDHGEFLALFRASFRLLKDEALMVNVFTAGSFLNPGEIPAETQVAIAEAVAKARTPRILRVESRLEYLTTENLRPTVHALRGKTLDVVIGFETQDDRTRQLLNKGMSKKGLRRGIDAVRRAGARASVYLMLKPHPVMTEGWAIEEAKASIREAFAAGAHEVQLQATYVTDPDPDGTKGVKNVMKHWHDRLGFRPPSLWSVVETLRDTADLGPVMLGKWEDEIPPPTSSPSDRNCDVCRDVLLDRIAAWRRTLSPEVFRDLPTCACRAAWEKETADRRRPPDGAFDRDWFAKVADGQDDDAEVPESGTHTTGRVSDVA